MCKEHGLEHGNTGGIPVLAGENRVDMVTDDAVTVAACAPGAGHPECGSIPENQHLIRPGNDDRRGPGRRWPKPPSVAVLAPAQAGPRWYVAEVDGRAARRARGESLAAAMQRTVRAGGWDAVVPQFLAERSEALHVGARRPARDGELRWAFPGFMLVEFDCRETGWRDIPHLPGVRRLAGLGPERPVPVRPVEAAWVLGQFGPDGVHRQPLVTKPAMPLAKGTRVRAVLGLLAGRLAGEVEESDGVSVWLWSGGKRVRLAQAAVEVVG